MSRAPFIARLGLLAGGLVIAGCSLNLSTAGQGQITKNQCSTDSDCGAGACWTGMCVAHQGSLPTVLFEVTPPATVEDIGGVRFLQVAKELTRSGTDYKLDLGSVSTVHGFVRAYDSHCGSGASNHFSVPVQVTISPREQSYGLPVVSYAATSQLVPVKGNACASQLTGADQVDEFVIALPTGKYDIYVAPQAIGEADAGATSSDCVPTLFSNQDASAACLALTQSAPESLAVAVQSPPGSQALDGFTVSVIHPVTGQVLSNQAVISGPATSLAIGATTEPTSGHVAHLNVSQIVGDASVLPAEELVRFSPPAGATAPVIQLQRSALQANFVPGQAATPAFGQFPAPVDLGSWVWSAAPFNEHNEEVGVPSTVTLTATALDGILPGIFASFSTTVTVGNSGSLDATVLPGSYRALAVPTVGLGLAVAQTTFNVACAAGASASGCAGPSDGPPPKQAGKVLLVPEGATLTGEVFAPTGNRRIDGASVQALPASFDGRQCVGTDGGDAAACAALPATVLDQSLGQDAFRPRAASAVATSGRFVMSEVDCGGCTTGTGALFDLSIRPPDGSEFPWLVKESVTVAGNVDFGLLTLPLPIIERGVVEVPQGMAAEPVPVAGALIRAYVVRDDRGNYVQDPEDLPSCEASTYGAPTPCNRSVVQIAETRAGSDGTFDLDLPATLN